MTDDGLRPPHACPNCGSTDFRLICYGLPTDETLEKADRDEVVLGGCTIWNGMPDWRCKNCDHAWFDPSDPARISWDEQMKALEAEHFRRLDGRPNA